MKKIDLIIFSVLGLFSVFLIYLLIISFNPAKANLLVNSNLKYGDLYQMAKVIDFKFPMPLSLPQNELNPIKNADIIIMGDSFFNVSSGYQYFADQIKNNINLKISNYNIQGSGELWRKTNPIEYLEETNFKPDNKKRILVLESVDRGLLMRYENIQKNNIKIKVENKFDKNDKNSPKGAVELVKLNNNHLRLEGWGADEESGSPLKEIIITIDGEIIGQAVTGFQRPDIVEYFKHNSWINSGWSFDADLDLSLNKHTLYVVFVDNNGNKVISNKKEINFTITQIDNIIKNKLRSFEYLITENPLSFLFSEIINTIEFKLFKQISSLTPKYSLNPNVLFYKDEVNFFENPLNSEQITKIADNLAYISTKLKNDYNIDFIFIPMPTKYTIYHEKTGSHTINNFFPLLFKELDKKNVQYVDFYSSFKSSNDFLYFQSDTHWNKLGIDIGVNNTIEKIKNLP